MDSSGKGVVVFGDYAKESVLNEAGKARISGGPLVDSTTVRSYEILSGEHAESVKLGLVPVGLLLGHVEEKGGGEYRLSVRFRDGGYSVMDVSGDVCAAVLKGCCVKSPGSCGVTLSDVLRMCEPRGLTNCSECPCRDCFLWPRCCFGRMMSRRTRSRQLF